MKREEILSSIEEIGTCEDENKRRSLLTNLTDNVGKVFDEMDLLNEGTKNLQESITKKEEELATAQKYNMDLFLKLNDQRKEVNSLESETGVKQEEKPVYKSYDELAKDFIK